MPQKIKPKRSYTANAVPVVSGGTPDIERNEIAINWTDSKLYTRNNSDQLVTITLGGGGGGGSTDSRWDLFLPAAPTGLTATGGVSQAALSWTAPTGVIAQAPITDYTVQFSSNSGSTWTTFSRAASTATTATVTGLTNGTAYVFRVAAVNGVGTGAYTAASSSVTPAAFSSLAVLLTSGTSYTVPSGATGMRVWAVGPGGQDGGARGHAGAVAYKTWSVSGGQSVAYSIGQRSVYSGSYSRSGSTTVTFGGTTITAEGGGGPNGPDAAATFSGGDGGANGGQGAYVNGRNTGGAVGGNGTLAECGRYPATDVYGLFAAVTLAGGNVVESCGATAAFGSGASEQAQSLAGIGGGGAWWGNQQGDDGGPGAVVLYFTANGFAPDAPTGLTPTAGNAQIALAWTAPAATGTSAITGYTVEYTPSGGSAQTVSTGSTGTSYTLTGLTNGTAYTVRVAAVSAAGTGAYSGTATATPAAGATVTGGTVTTPGDGYTYRTFTSSSDLVISGASLTCDVLVVGGGASGGGGTYFGGGGGGGGGVLLASGVSLAAGTYPVTVAALAAFGNNGGISSISTFSASGGLIGNAGDGGGGGAGGSSGFPTSSSASTRNSGGSPAAGANDYNEAGGGGGGAGGAGQNASPSNGGLGGSGRTVFGVTYGAGGRGGSVPSSTTANGAANTGNGGSGAREDNTGRGTGGSGLVVIRYV